VAADVDENVDGASGVSAEPLPEPADRGRLTIADRVVERVAVYAAAEVDGVARVGSTLEHAVGRRYPKADAQVAGQRVRVSVEIAVEWPAALSQVTGSVRRTVRDRVESLVGLEVDAVDVTAAKVVQLDPRTRRRVQ
jgi:uncharacterized alkaline shock family protein YloU